MNRMRTVSRSMLLAFLGLFAVGGAPVRAVSAGESLPARVRKAASEADTNRFPNADQVLVDSEVRASYDPSGTSSTAGDEYVKILTEKGRREAATQEFYFTLPYDRVEIEAAEVLSPDGSVRALDVASLSRVMVEPGQMQANIYDPNQKVLKLVLPGLEIGDMVHVRTLRRTVKPRVPGAWADYRLFEYTLPILRARYEVCAPEALPLKHRVLRSPVDETVAYESLLREDGTRLHRWTAENVPRMFREPDMPPLHTVVQRLLVSTIPDWETISRWYWNLSRPRLLAVTDEMRATVDGLIAEASGREEIIDRLFTFVSQKIRYMGVTAETEAPGYEPRDVGVTFARRYGVCRDKAALLVAMLRLAEIPAYPTLIHTGALKDPEAPQPFFNHAIVAVEDAPGTYRLLDPTGEVTREQLPAMLCHRSYLVAHPEGERLRVSPVYPARANRMRIRTRARFSDDERLLVTSELEFDGINDSMYRAHLARLAPRERRLFFEGLFNARLSGGFLTDLRIVPEDPRDTETPLRVTLRGHGPNLLERRGGRGLIHLPWMGEAVGFANYAVGGLGLEKRRYPLELRTSCAVDEEILLDLPDDLDPAGAGFRVEREIPGVSLRHEVETVDGETVRARQEFFIEAPQIPPDLYPELKGLLGEREWAYRYRPVLKDAEPDSGPDARVEQFDTRVRIDASGGWERIEHRRVKVLTFAGQERMAELSVAYNPAWQEAELLSATVTNPDGRMHTVDPAAINIMDAEWTGAAPRYPAGRILVVNLPAVAPGSVIEYRLRRAQRAAPVFSLRHVFGGLDPVEHASLRITAPRDVPLRTRSLNGPVDYSASTNATSVTHVWQVRDLAAGGGEDHLPPPWGYLPSVLASAFEWDAYAEQVRREVENAADAEEVRALGRRLTEEARTAREKLRRIRDYAARALRPAGPEFTDLPLAFTGAATTLRDGYGHGADRAVALLALVRGAGFEQAEAIPVTSDGGLPDPLSAPLRAVPQRDLFNHMLVRVPLADGEVWLNDTDQYAPLGAVRHAGGLCLESDGTFERVAPPPEFEDAEIISRNLRVARDGAVVIVQTNLYYGISCADFRKRFTELPPEERRRHGREMAARLSRTAEPVGPLRTDLAAHPGMLTMTVRADPYTSGDAGGRLLELPGAGHTYPRIRGDRRAHPLRMGAATRKVRRWRVVLPENAVVRMMPGNEDFRLPGGLGTVEVRTRRRRDAAGRPVVVVEEEQRRAPGFLEAEAYPALRNVDIALRAPRRWMVMYATDGDATGSPPPAPSSVPEPEGDD